MFYSMMLHLFSILLLITASVATVGNSNSYFTSSDKQIEYVDSVRQNYDETINQMLSEQITRELEASYVYQAYASYFQRADVNLPGIQKFFTKASAEEKQHAQMLIDYVNKRGGHVVFDDVDLMDTCRAIRNRAPSVSQDSMTTMCICSFVSPKELFPTCPQRTTWTNGLYAFEDALSVERFVNEELLKIHQKADEEKDAHLSHFLEHEFLEEQVNSISELGHIVTRLRSFEGTNYALGEYLFDQKMG